MTILIVDDVAADNLYLSAIASGAGHEVVSADSPYEGLIYASRSDPALVVVDYLMPGLDGVQFIAKFRETERHASTPILMITGAGEAKTRLAALEAGATDFMLKPVDPREWQARLRNLTKLTEARRESASLRAKLARATATVRESELELVARLVRAAKYRDPETAEHIVRTGEIAADLARRMGFAEDYCEQLRHAMQLHDVGKVGIPDSVLNKPGALTTRERAEMNKHVLCGRDILKGSSSELIRMAEEIALTHHERWNGGGYPFGLRGEDIPISGRIAAVADVFDALTSRRPYKAAWSQADALAYLKAESGRMFDPRCIDAFLGGFKEDAATIG